MDGYGDGGEGWLISVILTLPGVALRSSMFVD